MTIVAVYRNDNQSIFISDFRVTNNSGTRKSQKDISNKFVEINKKIGFFLAGDVIKWKKILEEVDLIEKDITFKNILEDSGLLKNRLLDLALKEEGKKCSAIGFILDESTKLNKVFRIDFRPGYGCSVEEVENKQTTIIGSGSMIPDIHKRINQAIKKESKNFNTDRLFDLANIMRNEIKHSLGYRPGCRQGDAFSELGISPVMSMSTLSGSYFEMQGEEISGEVVQQNYTIDFSYSQNNEDYKLVLKDNLKQKTRIIENINNTNQNSTGDIFDPENLENNNCMGNSNSMKLHKLNCPYAKKTSESNRVYFNSKDEATGYVPCKVCKP